MAKDAKQSPSGKSRKRNAKDREEENRSEYSDVPYEYKFESWWREQRSPDWVVVAEKVKGEEDFFGTSWLLPKDPERIARIFRKVDFDGHIGDGLPTFGRS